MVGSLGSEDGCRCDETRNVIPSLGFKTCMTMKSQVFSLLFWAVLNLTSDSVVGFR